jgi:hypothetical protein
MFLILNAREGGSGVINIRTTASPPSTRLQTTGMIVLMLSTQPRPWSCNVKMIPASMVYRSMKQPLALSFSAWVHSPKTCWEYGGHVFALWSPGRWRIETSIYESFHRISRGRLHFSKDGRHDVSSNLLPMWRWHSSHGVAHSNVPSLLTWVWQE